MQRPKAGADGAAPITTRDSAELRRTGKAPLRRDFGKDTKAATNRPKSSHAVLRDLGDHGTNQGLQILDLKISGTGVVDRNNVSESRDMLFQKKPSSQLVAAAAAGSDHRALRDADEQENEDAGDLNFGSRRSLNAGTEDAAEAEQRMHDMGDEDEVRARI
jgi:hypothetical protein